MSKKSSNKKRDANTPSEEQYTKAVRTDAALSVFIYLLFVAVYLVVVTIIAIGCKQHVFVQYSGGVLLIISAVINIVWRFQLGQLSRKKKFFNDNCCIEDKYAIVSNFLVITGTLLATFYSQWCSFVIRVWG